MLIIYQHLSLVKLTATNEKHNSKHDLLKICSYWKYQGKSWFAMSYFVMEKLSIDDIKSDSIYREIQEDYQEIQILWCQLQHRSIFQILLWPKHVHSYLVLLCQDETKCHYELPNCKTKFVKKTKTYEVIKWEGNLETFRILLLESCLNLINYVTMWYIIRQII